MVGSMSVYSLDTIIFVNKCMNLIHTVNGQFCSKFHPTPFQCKKKAGGRTLHGDKIIENYNSIIVIPLHLPVNKDKDNNELLKVLPLDVRKPVSIHT